MTREPGDDDDCDTTVGSEAARMLAAVRFGLRHDPLAKPLLSPERRFNLMLALRRRRWREMIDKMIVDTEARLERARALFRAGIATSDDVEWGKLLRAHLDFLRQTRSEGDEDE